MLREQSLPHTPAPYPRSSTSRQPSLDPRLRSRQRATPSQRASLRPLHRRAWAGSQRHRRYRPPLAHARKLPAQQLVLDNAAATASHPHPGASLIQCCRPHLGSHPGRHLRLLLQWLSCRLVARSSARGALADAHPDSTHVAGSRAVATSAPAPSTSSAPQAGATAAPVPTTSSKASWSKARNEKASRARAELSKHLTKARERSHFKTSEICFALDQSEGYVLRL